MKRLVRILGCALPALLVAALALGPFHDKAYTIDDTLFLRQAEHALVDPLHPAAFDIVWLEALERVSSIMPSGPVMAYLLVPVVRRGAPEWLAHLVMYGVLGLGVLATVALGLRLGLGRGGAALAALLVVAAPAVLGMASTAMPDVPAMSFGVLAMERLSAWREERRLHQALLAALAFALAALARSHLLLLLGVAALALVPEETLFDVPGWLRPAPWRALARRAWPLFLGALLVVAVIRLVRDPLQTGGDVSSAALGFATYRHLDRNLLAFALHWVLSVPLTLPWALVRWRRLRWRLMVDLVLLALVLLGLAGELHWPWLAPLAGLSVLVLVDLFTDAWRRRDALELVLGAWLLIALPVVVYVNFPPKFQVASAPAVAILLVRLVGRERPAGGGWLLGSTVGLGVCLGVLVVRADARLADMGRRAARELIAPRVARGERVWFAGHWGFQWYAEAAGARALTPISPGPGAIVVSSYRADPRALKHYPRRRWIGGLVDPIPGGRVMEHSVCAGFYSNQTGYLPWMWSDKDSDRFDVWVLE